MNADNGSYAGSVSSEDRSVRDGLRILRRRWWIPLLTIVLASGAAGGASLAMRPVYEASATLIADKNPPVVLLGGAGQADPGLFAQQPVSETADVSTMTELAKSRAVREAAAGRLSPPLDRRRVDMVLEHVNVARVSDTDIVRLSVDDTDPHVATIAADAMAASVVDMDLQARRRFATTARQFIGARLDAAGRRLQANEMALVAFRDQNHAVSLSDETQLNLRRLADLEGQRFDVQLAEQAIRASPSDPSGAVGQSSGATQQVPADPVVADLHTQLATLQVELAGLRKQFTPVYPAVIAVQAKIEETQRRIAAEASQRQAALVGREGELSSAINRIQGQLEGVPTLEATLARLTRDTQAAERDYTLLSERFREAQIAEGSIGSAVRIVDVAKIPETPIRPKRGLYVILGAVLGLVVGVVGVVAVEQLDDSLRSPEDAERLVGIPVLGVVPPLRIGGRGGSQRRGRSAEPLDRRPAAVEAFRFLRTRLLRATQGATAQCLLVTSAEPREGKSTIAAHLAVAIASLEPRVRLVDCNLRHPTLTRFFPEADSPGLSALLAGDATIDSVVRHVEPAGLQCVAGGAAAPSSTELLGTSRMAQFLREARKDASVTVLDGPSVLPTADAEILASQADGAVIVVRIGASRHALSRAHAALERSGVRIVGVVLNNVKSRGG